MGALDLSGWTPVRARPEGGELKVEWRWLPETDFREPFFAETVQLALERPFSLLVPAETGIDALAEAGARREPDGLILHLSRCGSTLVTQMLAALPGALALSEPLLVNDVLRAPGDEAERARRLRLAVGALGRPAERPYVVKLDAWATHDLPVIRRAFPGTPWLFLARDPLEVLVSHARQPGMHMLPTVISPGLFGLDPAIAVTMPFAEYGAFVLGAICRQAAAARDELALFLDYRDLPGAVVERVLAWFGIAVSDGEVALLEAASRLDAKNPDRAFAPDAAAKAAAATPELRAAVERWARAPYEALPFD